MNIQDLTFGIELEILCLRPETLFDTEYGDPPYPDCERYDIGGGPVIWKALVDNRIPATGYEASDTEYTGPTYSTWRVEIDSSLRAGAEEQKLLPDGWTCDQIELCSRKFSFFRDNWRNEIADVLKLVKEIEKRGCRFITNLSTGFHCHVGHSNGLLPLRIAKNVFQICTTFERCIDELHTAPRIAVPDPMTDDHNYFPLSFFHTYGPDYDPDTQRSTTLLLDRLEKIEHAETYEDIGSFFDIARPEIGIDRRLMGHKASLNFDNLFPSREYDRWEGELKGTIEFRQHTGTLNEPDVFAWVILACSIVSFAATSDVTDLIIRGVDPNFRLVDFLNAIGCQQDLIEHYSKEAIIGAIGEGSHLTGERIENPIDTLIDMNDQECEERASYAAVAAAIDKKSIDGLYGLDGNMDEVELKTSVVDAELQKAQVTVHMSGTDVRSEKGISIVRAQVLRHFADLYRAGKLAPSESEMQVNGQLL